MPLPGHCTFTAKKAKKEGPQLGVVDHVPQPGQHLRHPRHAPHARDQFQLHHEVVEVAFSLRHLLPHPRGVGVVDLRRGPLHEGDHVAHAKDAQRHPIGVEGLKVLRALADANGLHWLPGHAADGNGGAAPGAAIKLDQDTAAAAEAMTAAALTLVSDAAAMLTAAQSAADGGLNGDNGSAAIAMQ